MIPKEQTDKVIEILKTRIAPVFAYFVEDAPGEHTSPPLLEIPYFAGLEADEYRLCELEDELAGLLGMDVSLIELGQCDPIVAGELLAEGRLVYCQNSPAHVEFLHSIAKEFEAEGLRRRMLIDRLEHCASIFEQ